MTTSHSTHKENTFSDIEIIPSYRCFYEQSFDLKIRLICHDMVMQNNLNNTHQAE